jgi:hypothetical protein
MKTKDEFINEMKEKQVPEEVINYFIKNDRNIKFSIDEKLDVQQIELFKYDEIENIDITISTWEYRENYNIKEDPNIEEDGYYRISAINFVKEVNDYLSEGLLVWIPDIKQFGTCDTDHGVVYIFKDIKWDQIIENIFTYTNTQWNFYEPNIELLETKYKIFDIYRYYKPWELWEFIKD